MECGNPIIEDDSHGFSHIGTAKVLNSYESERMKGYLIEKYSCMTNAYTCNRLVEEAKKLGIELQIVGIHDAAVRADGIYVQGQKLPKADFVINRYKWGETVAMLNTLAGRSYNAYAPFARFVNKFEQVHRLHSEKFLMPHYLLATGKYPYEQLRSQLGSPFVAKGLESSMGEEIILIENETQYADLQSMYSMEKEWLFEEFIQTSVGRDLRYFCIRGDVVAGMIRKSKGDFRANVALGATVEMIEPTAEIRQIAADIYEQTGLDFVGLDLLFGEKLPYFCEINVMPGIEGMERATGVNIAAKMMELIREQTGGIVDV